MMAKFSKDTQSQQVSTIRVLGPSIRGYMTPDALNMSRLPTKRHWAHSNSFAKLKG